MWRLPVAILLFLLSLLVLFRAPTNFFWKVTIVITEFPYYSVAIAAAFFISCFYTERFRIPLLAIAALSLIFFLLPLVGAYSRGKDLAADLGKIFPFRQRDDLLQQPFSLIRLFTGINNTKITPTVYRYKNDLTLDFYPTASAGNSPCLIVIHGGSWASGDSKEIPGLNSYLAARGVNVAAINYRLAPAYQYPAPVKDTRDALAFLKKNAERLHIDTSSFVLLGRSAGAQIALMAAYTFHDKDIKGVISYYGPADMVWGAQIRSNKLVLNTDKIFRDYLGGLINEVPQRYHESCACDAAGKDSPPTLLVHGPIDPLVAFGHSRHLNKKLRECGVPHYFLDLPFATHGCDYNPCGPSGQLMTFATERFINSVTSPSWKK